MSKFIFLLLVFVGCQSDPVKYKSVQLTPDTQSIPELPFALSPPERVLWVNGKAEEGDTIWVWNARSTKNDRNMIHVGKYDPKVEFSQRYIYKKVK